MITKDGIDEDLIAGYKCRLCDCNVCKDEAFARVGLTCVCLDCSIKGEQELPAEARANGDV